MESSASFAVLVAVICCFSTVESILAIAVSVAVHEIGHLAVMKLSKIRIRRIRAELKGLCILYDGTADGLCIAVSALAGPAAGMIYAFIVLRWGNGWLKLSANVSFVLSVFNLLPAFPLDGGRIMTEIIRYVIPGEKGKSISVIISVLVSCAVFIAGLILYNRGYGAAVFSAGLWLLICQNEAMGIVKKTEIS